MLSQTATANTCSPGSLLNPQPSQDLQVLGTTNWRPRMSTGLELQMFLPVVNAPFRIYWAYNPLRLDNAATPPIPITRGMFPSGQSAGSRRLHYQPCQDQSSPRASCCGSHVRLSASPWLPRSKEWVPRLGSHGRFAVQVRFDATRGGSL